MDREGNDTVKGDMAIDEFLEELKDCYVEHSFTSRWSLIEGYHLIGSMIIEQGSSYGEYLVGQVAGHLQKSERTIRYAVDLASHFKSLDDLPEGKNISWYGIIKKYLTTSTGEKVKKVKLIKCPKCGFEWEK